jgi:hypothetical protein
MTPENDVSSMSCSETEKKNVSVIKVGCNAEFLLWSCDNLKQVCMELY